MGAEVHYRTRYSRRNLRVDAEQKILALFKQQAQNYLDAAKIPMTELEWWARIQHHGGPTRLIDWSNSRWVAVFFALEQPPAADDRCVLWAANAVWLRDQSVAAVRANRGLPNEADAIDLVISAQHDVRFRTEIRSNDHRTIFELSPFRLSERLTLQQGTFLCAGDLRLSTIENWPVTPDADQHLFKIEISSAARRPGIQYLLEHNISSATLFPGLDGFTRSLGHHVIPETDLERNQRLLMEALLGDNALNRTRVND